MLENLFTLLKKTDEEVIIQLSDENHPIFKAHFPGFPLLPGFLIIEIIANILNVSIKKVHSGKFISHALPNDIIVYNIKKDQLKTKIKIVKNDEKNGRIAEVVYE